MLATLVTLLFAPPTIKAPILPPGCSPDFQRQVLAVEQSLKDGDFTGAGKKLQLLPKNGAFYSWDDAKVPAGQRAAFAQARDAAIAGWAQSVGSGFSVRPGAQADIKFGFEQKLANGPATGAPMGLATFVSETALPRLESVIGLARGPESRPSTPIDVQNDVAYSIGNYLGIADRPIATTSMARTDALAVVPNVVTPGEVWIARQNLAAVETLRQAVHSQVKLEPSQPKASYDALNISYGPIMQGQTAVIPLLITNIGQGRLRYLIMPSCSCISGGPEGDLKPNEAKLVDITVDTTEWTHTLNKQLMILTNDADNPVRVIPLEVKITPRYRWIVPGGPARLVGDSGADIDLYLDLPLASGIYPKDVQFQGIPGKVDIQPWTGDLADPANGEGVKPRDGYRVKLHVTGDVLGGRQVGTVMITTTSEKFPQINYNLSFQKGIVAFPDDLNMGMVSSKITKPYYIYLSRPIKPFRVLAVNSTSKNIQATFSKVDGSDDYRIEVKPNGKLPAGDYVAILHVFTDDPRQGKIDIPVRGTVE